MREPILATCCVFSIAIGNQRTRQHIEQIRRIVKPPKQRTHATDSLPLAVLAAFPDRVARRKKDNQLLLASGGSATLACESQADFLVAVDIEDRSEPRPATGSDVLWNRTGMVDRPVPDRVRERSGVEWNRAAERVDASSALLYDGLVIQETRSGSPDPEQAAALLAERAIELGVERFVDPDLLSEFLARISFASEHSAAIPKIDVESAFTELCRGRKSFAELRSAGPAMIAMLEQRANPKLLNEIAPLGFVCPAAGKRASITKRASRRGWHPTARFLRHARNAARCKWQSSVGGSSARAQSTPGSDHVRPCGFWERLYPQVRRELSRRYPKHAWPENRFLLHDGLINIEPVPAGCIHKAIRRCQPVEIVVAELRIDPADCWDPSRLPLQATWGR